MDIYVNQEQYDALEERLAEEPRSLPRLADLMRKPSALQEEKPADFLARYLDETGH